MSSDPQVVLPLVDQYFKNHRLYFLSTAIHPISSGGHASNKEKEMVTRYQHSQHNVVLQDVAPALMYYCTLPFLMEIMCMAASKLFASGCVSLYLSHLRIFFLSSLMILPLSRFLFLLLEFFFFSLFCKLGVLVRNRISLFGKNTCQRFHPCTFLAVLNRCTCSMNVYIYRAEPAALPIQQMRHPKGKINREVSSEKSLRNNLKLKQ